MRLTSSIPSGTTCSTSPRMIHSNPSRTPTTSTPSSALRMVAAPMTLLMPGAGPPATRIASFFRWLIYSASRTWRLMLCRRGGTSARRRSRVVSGSRRLERDAARCGRERPAVRVVLGDGRSVRNGDDRCPRQLLADELVHPSLHRLVEGGGRLVEEEPARRVEERAHEREPLLLVRRQHLVPRLRVPEARDEAVKA